MKLMTNTAMTTMIPRVLDRLASEEFLPAIICSENKGHLLKLKIVEMFEGLTNTPQESQ